MPLEDFAAILVAAAVLTGLISLNVADFRRRRAMTPEQRADEDHELRNL